MIMTPGVRKIALVTHVGASVGWFGAVLTSLVLAIAGWLGTDPEGVRAVYLVLDLVGWYALVPLSLASLLTGLVQSLGTTWGLLRHYWVVFKLILNLVATAVLLLYTQTLDFLADTARATTPGQPNQLSSPSPVIHAVAAAVVLLVALVLSIYKPRGLTAYGQRTQRRPHRPQATQATGQAVLPQ